METFSDFLERIHAFEYPSFHLEHDVFQPPLTLADKVRPDGSYRRFTGDTILYWLDQQTQKTLSIWQDSLYARAGALLSDKLNNAQMHVTLHDLSLGQPEKLCHYAKKQLSELKQEPISMRMTVVFPLAATSLAIALEPINEKEYQKWITRYEKTEQIVRLPCLSTPHITLAYFRPKMYTKQEISLLQDWLDEYGYVDRALTLEPEYCQYISFYSMNDYKSS